MRGVRHARRGWIRREWFRRVLPAFGGARSGYAPTEFALLLPVLLAIFVGTAEYARAISNWRKLTVLARTVADLTAQGDVTAPISSTTMDDILSAASAVLRPFDSSSVQIVVSAMGVDIDKNGLKPAVCSSVANANATKRPVAVASDLTVPQGFQTTGVRYVLAEASMDYRPMLGSALVNLFGSTHGTIRLAMNLPWPARGGQKYGANTYTEVVMPNGAECK